jgi:hypothetical protein
MGDCVCKSCSKGQSKSVVKKRALPPQQPQEKSFDAPFVRSKRQTSSPDILPGRQPSLPDGFQPSLKAAPPVQIPYDRDSAGFFTFFLLFFFLFFPSN